jgi:uncharacterized lipoprotein YmbA
MTTCARLSALLFAILTSCASRAPPHLYLLAPPAYAGFVIASGASAIQLQTVLVPDYLDTTDILLRAGPHEVKASTTAQWAERLSQGVTHALQADLSMGGAIITTNPPADPSAAQILVTIDDFDVWPNGHCVLAAHWTILRHASDAHGVDQRAVITMPPSTGGDASLVAAMAGAVDQLAARIRKEAVLF